MRFKNDLNMLHLVPTALLGVASVLSTAQGAMGQEVGVKAELESSIEFEISTYDLGSVSDTQAYKVVFPFANRGGGTLEILDVKASCGCTTPVLPKKFFAPGELSEIGVQFKPKGGGAQSKNITIFTNDPSQPVIMLTVEADVTQFLPTEPRLARFDAVQKGDSKFMDLELKPLDPDAVINGVSISGLAAKWFKASIIPDAEGNTASSRLVRIELLPGAPRGQQYASANIVVTGRPAPDADEVTHSASVTVSAKIVGALYTSSTVFRVSTVPPGELFTSVVKLARRDGKSFQVLSATLSGSTVEDMAVHVAPVAAENGGGYSIVLTGTPMRAEQRINGVVKMYTDVPGEEELSLRVGGIARNRS
jgi:hypothetical protein